MIVPLDRRAHRDSSSSFEETPSSPTVLRSVEGGVYCRNSLIEGENGIGQDPGALRVAADRCGKRSFGGALFGCSVWLPAARMVLVTTAAAIVPAVVAGIPTAGFQVLQITVRDRIVSERVTDCRCLDLT